MNKQNKLTLQMTFFFLFVIVLFGTIVIKEKQNVLFLPKIKKSITNYIASNYKDLNLIQNKISEKNNVFTMKVTNPINKNHYFYINYSQKKINDTYKTDYFEGKTLLNHLSKKLERKLLEETDKNYIVTFDNTLNNYSSKIQDKLLSEDIKSLKIYTIEKEYICTWNKDEITKKITDTMVSLEKKSFTPKNYTITITNINDITQSVKITNLQNNYNLPAIINDIINNNKSNIIKENKITFEYLN